MKKKLRSACDVCGSSSYVQQYLQNDLCLCSKHRHQLERKGEIFDRSPTRWNEIEIRGDIARVLLKNRKKEVVGKAVVDVDKVDYIRKITWSLSDYGYAITGPRKGESRLMHVFLFGKRKGKLIDHINGDRLDNRSVNIRFVSYTQSAYNRAMQSNNTSGVYGVYYDKTRNKYVAEIKHDGKKTYLGRFDLLRDAKAAREEAEKKYFGEFRRVKM